MSAGIVLRKKYGDYVKKGEVLAYAHTNKENVESVFKDIHDAFKISSEKVNTQPIVSEYICK